jgi:two-component system LytT family sensor kinase
MKAFKKFCLLTILSYTIFIIPFIIIFDKFGANFTSSLWSIFSYFLGYFVLTSFSYVYIFERLQNKSKRIARNLRVAVACLLILVLIYRELLFAINENFYPNMIYQYFLCICIFSLEYLGMILLAYSSKSYKLVFDEKILFYIKLIVSISAIVSLFGMILILSQIENAFPSFEYSINKVVAISLEIGMHCLLVTIVSLVLIWGLSRFSWFKKNNLFIVVILFLSLTFLLRLQIRVYDNHHLNSFFDPSTLSGPLLMVVLLYRNKQRTTDFKLKSLTNAVSKKEAEYSQLKQQVNPHFLFNNLNTLISFIEIDPKKAVEFGHHLSNTYRHYLKNQNDDFVSLKEELEFIKEYLEIYKAKFENSFTFKISAVPKENEYILSLSLQEIVDNVFKHNNMDDQNPLVIRIFRSENGLLIENSVSNKASDQSNHVGLENINKRYKILVNKEIQVVSSSYIYQVNLPILALEA